MSLPTVKNFPEGLLTIAIPTFNRCKELSQLLEWIDRYVPVEIEVVVRDNASTDRTWEMLNEWSSKTPRKASIFRNPTNTGIDANILAVSRDCSTKWFWWMGDDDLFDPDVAQRIFRILTTKQEIGVIFLNYGLWDGRLPAENLAPVLRLRSDIKMDATESFQAVKLLCETIGFISALVVRRQDFLQFDDQRPRWISETAFDFVYAVKSLIEKRGVIILQNANIWFRCGREPRGFNWVKAGSALVRILSQDDHWIDSIKKRTELGSVFIKRGLLPRLRVVLRRGDVSLPHRIKLCGQFALTFWTCWRFWFSVVPRLFLLRSMNSPR